MQPYRDIAVLAGTQVLCFLLLAQFEPSFVVIHLYQSILYLAILILLYYREDRWAYMIAMLASAVWLAASRCGRRIVGSITTPCCGRTTRRWGQGRRSPFPMSAKVSAAKAFSA